MDAFKKVLYENGLTFGAYLQLILTSTDCGMFGGTLADVLLRLNGLALWLWFLICVLATVWATVAAVLVVMQSTLTLASLCGLAVCLISFLSIAISYFVKGRSGWVFLSDNGWDMLRLEARAEEDDRSLPSMSSPPRIDISEVKAKRLESFTAYAMCNTLLGGLCFVGLAGTCATVALFWLDDNVMAAAAFALLAFASSTLPLFANLHLAQEQGRSTAAALSLTLAVPFWVVCATAALGWMKTVSALSCCVDTCVRSKPCACHGHPRRHNMQLDTVPEEGEGDQDGECDEPRPFSVIVDFSEDRAPHSTPLPDYENVIYLPESVAETTEGLDDEDDSSHDSSFGVPSSPGALAHLPSIEY